MESEETHRTRQKEYADKHRDYYRKKSREFYQKYKLKGYFNRKYKEYSTRYPEKTKAHNIVNNSNLRGNSCIVCGINQNLEAHHFDYSQPANIYTFCREHHTEVHYGIN
ncbi:hypothetical protein LCGC14_1917060 [marine sediment metagenome]|uniref:Uncharacterized protein n=1 Tax=marine sediment metagenome TaxID=412755 RepID=A0A0F9IPN0_9ZZZZ